MPIDRRKETESAKSVTAANDKIVEAPSDPATVMSGTQLNKEKKGKKKKKKSAKLSKLEKATEKLNLAADAIRANDAEFQSFVRRVNSWMKKYGRRAADLFLQFDVDGDGLLTYDEFKSGMFDLNVPFNRGELHLLARLLDKDKDGSIDYVEFSRGLSSDGDQDDSPQDTGLVLSTRTIDHCSCCKMGLQGPYVEQAPRFIKVIMKLVTFDNFHKHPAHFSKLVHSHLTVFGLAAVIEQETGIQSSQIHIFHRKSREKEYVLAPERTLEECGFKAGTRSSPTEALLYYDYKVEFTDCPILMCDHYFGKK